MHDVIVVDERALRRIIKEHYKLPGMGLQVPHTSSIAVPRDAVKSAELDVSKLPERVVVVHGDADVMTMWRRTFHARVHQAFDAQIESGALTPAVIRTRIRTIGQTEFDEIRFVLRAEDMLLPPEDDTRTYVEFAATYLELRLFAPSTIARTFPAAYERHEEIDAVIALDVDAQALLAASRPEGAPAVPVVAEPPVTVEPVEAVVVPAARKSATSARTKGNRAKAAILAIRSGDEASARIDLDELVGKLEKTLATKASPAWTEALLLVARAAAAQKSMRFNAAARLLHDLQTACVLAEKEVRAVDVIGWALSRGKTKIVRPLPATRDVRLARRVHAAAHKVAAVQLGSRDERKRVADAMHEIAAAADERLRTAYRPVITAALHAVGLEPRGIPERVAEKTLVDELLDRAVKLGRLTLGDLRDALSRNDLKLPDLRASDLRDGDPLLRADAILARSLDGVYRRGESYMRWLQRISSLFFATRVGRFLTRYALLPLLGSFALVEGAHHMSAPFAAKLGYEVQISTRETLLIGAGALFLLLHVRPLRQALWFALQWLWRGLRGLLWDIPRWVWRHPAIRWLMRSWLVQWIVRPAIPAAIALAIAWQLDPWRWVIAGGTFAVAAFAMNTRFIRLAEEIAVDWLVRTGRQIGRIAPGLVKLTLEVFSRLLDLLERAIYRVDEFLRFRKGSPILVILLKGFFGTLWFFLTYLLRLYVNLFVEPTVNPIKHFPVVTVAAKIILPFIPAMLSGIANVTAPLLGRQLANAFAGFTVVVLPGLAGFLVWEFKENWRLYRATRSRTLQPLIVGSHGETIARLLRPGFHSGTIPKLYTKIRRAAWRNDESMVARAKEALHHVEESVTIFVERQLASLLAATPAFGATDVAVTRVELASNRIDIWLACPSISPEPTEMRLELAGRWIVASLATPGWMGAVRDEKRRRILEIALAGFYKLSAVDLVREQIAHVLGPKTAFDLVDEGLVVWPGQGFETEIVYDLRSRKLKRTVRGALLEGETPALAGRHIMFAREPVYWSAWSTAWHQLERGDMPMAVATGPSLLPSIPS